MPVPEPSDWSEYGSMGSLLLFIITAGGATVRALWSRDETSRARMIAELDAERKGRRADREDFERQLAEERRHNYDRLHALEVEVARIHEDQIDERERARGMRAPPESAELRAARLLADIVRARQDATPEEPPNREG